MLNDILLHKTAKERIVQAIEQPTQGYIFVGPKGSGKYTTAHRLAKSWSANAASTIVIAPDNKQSIGVSQIHSLREDVSHKLSSSEYRTIIVDDAPSMSLEAQNALLKLLEEPPLQTTFILIADSMSDILPTVRSRLAIIRFPFVDEGMVVRWLVDVLALEPAEAKRAYHIGNKTLGGAMNAHNNLEVVQQAKNFINSDYYERFSFIATLASDRSKIRVFVQDLKSIYEAVMWSSALQNDLSSALFCARRLHLLLSIEVWLSRNVNVRLASSQLVLEL